MYLSSLNLNDYISRSVVLKEIMLDKYGFLN